jgi:hypothetical protein
MDVEWQLAVLRNESSTGWNLDSQWLYKEIPLGEEFLYNLVERDAFNYENDLTANTISLH